MLKQLDPKAYASHSFSHATSKATVVRLLWTRAFADASRRSYLWRAAPLSPCSMDVMQMEEDVDLGLDEERQDDVMMKKKLTVLGLCK